MPFNVTRSSFRHSNTHINTITLKATAKSIGIRSSVCWFNAFILLDTFKTNSFKTSYISNCCKMFAFSIALRVCINELSSNLKGAFFEWMDQNHTGPYLIGSQWYKCVWFLLPLDCRQLFSVRLQYQKKTGTDTREITHKRKLMQLVCLLATYYQTDE